MVEVSWSPDPLSTQDSYKVQYHEVEATIGGDSNVLITNKTRVGRQNSTKINFEICLCLQINVLLLYTHLADSFGRFVAWKELFNHSRVDKQKSRVKRDHFVPGNSSFESYH